jgi:hypothetical protein
MNLAARSRRLAGSAAAKIVTVQAASEVLMRGCLLLLISLSGGCVLVGYASDDVGADQRDGGQSADKSAGDDAAVSSTKPAISPSKVAAADAGAKSGPTLGCGLANICSPLCTTPNCDVDCVDATYCSTTCSKSTNCTLGCSDSTYCHLGCAAAATCAMDCADGLNCSLGCAAGSTCDVGCLGSALCRTDCAAGAKCDVDCTHAGLCSATCAKGSTCDVDCTGADDCLHVDCAEGASCILHCANNTVGCALSCRGVAMTCPGGVETCDAPCP